MRRAVKRAGVLVTLSALAAVAMPGTATAAPMWYDNPASCISVSTVASTTSGDRFLQLRKGTCGGTKYVWARANGNYKVELGVFKGTEGNVGANSTQNGSGKTHYTKGRRIDSDLWFVGDTSWASPVAYFP